MLFFGYFSVFCQNLSFWTQTSSSFFFDLFNFIVSQDLLYICQKQKKLWRKVVFWTLEMLTIFSDIFEHVLMQGTHKLAVPDETKSQIPKAPGTVPCGPLSHNRFIYMQLPPSLLGSFGKDLLAWPFYVTKLVHALVRKMCFHVVLFILINSFVSLICFNSFTIFH